MAPIYSKLAGGKKEKGGNKRKKYSKETLQLAVRKVVDENWSVYKSAKKFFIPWSTLKDYITRCEGDSDSVDVRKVGRPFALGPATETSLVKFVINMQELGFGLTVSRIRHIAYSLAEKECASNNKPFPFSDKKKCASWKWWREFRRRYNLGLRTPENLSQYRANNSNRVLLNDFYDKLSEVYEKFPEGIKPQQIWNCDETGLCYVVKSGRVVTRIGKRFVYNRVIADKAETHTVLPCINAAGEFGPTLLIFKGARMIDGLKIGALPNVTVAVSQSGWINSELFLMWFQKFVQGISSARPVALLMDSHASHITPEVIAMASENDIIIVTFPSHTSHLLQPLDVAVYRPLKLAWQKHLRQFQEGNPLRRPGRFDFHGMFSPAFLEAFSRENIISAFCKAGVFPLNKMKIPDEALTTNVDNRCMDENSLSVSNAPATKEGIDDVLKLPDFTARAPKPARKRRDPSAAVHLPGEKSCGNTSTACTSSSTSDTTKSCVSASTSSLVKAKKNTNKSKGEAEDEWFCPNCNESYYKGHNKSPWIQCCFCLNWYPESCQAVDSKNPPTVFMCSVCARNEENDSDSD
ncbi:uncharacterized protein LOC129234057 [Uloborus diversus]|uniref:uncharacterized protein LOC129234057 n=1 Tax=Uloborus diversus TaxID=327109 RepID=UPI0024094EC3|nr:uncharacterized protein LOC129234057 [Uloborus diversus]